MSIFDGVVAPEIRVEFDLGLPMGPKTAAASVWEPVATEQVRAISIRRGKSIENQKVQPGECVITFDNRTGDFDPMNEGSPWWNPDGSPVPFSWLSPRLGVRVIATWDEVDFSLFNGFLEQLTMDYGLNPTTTITFVDALGWLAQRDLEAYETPEGNGDQVWYRCNRILDLLPDGSGAYGFPEELRGISESVDNTMYGTTYGADVMTLLQQAADCGPARLHVDRDGLLRVMEWDAGNDAGLVFSDDQEDAEAVGYDLILVDPGAKYLVNEVEVVKVDGTGTIVDTVTDQDAASIQIYGVSNQTYTLPVNTAAPVAAFLAYQYSTPINRVQRIGFPAMGLDNNFTKVLVSDLADNMTVTRTTYDGRTVTFGAVIEGIEHDITPESWRMGYVCSTKAVLLSWMTEMAATSTSTYGFAAADADGLYATFQPNSTGAGLAKFSNSGSVSWQQHSVPSGEFDYLDFYQITSVADGVCVVGPSSIYGGLVARFGTDGALIWARQLAGSAEYETNLHGIVTVADDATVSCGTSDNKALLAKHAANGSLSWTAAFTGSNGDTFAAVTVDGDGNLFAACMGATTGALIKFDSSGTILWQRTCWFGNNDNSSNILATDSSGNVYVAHKHSSTSAPVISKYDSSGAVQWRRSITSGKFTSVCLDADENVYVGGYIGDSAVILSFDASGALLWQGTVRRNALTGWVRWKGMSTTSRYLWIVGETTTSSGQYNVLTAYLPLDGSNTGTYNFPVDLLYEVGVLTVSSVTLSDAAASMSATSQTITQTTPTFTTSATSLTATVGYLEG